MWTQVGSRAQHGLYVLVDVSHQVVRQVCGEGVQLVVDAHARTLVLLSRHVVEGRLKHFALLSVMDQALEKLVLKLGLIYLRKKP